MNQSKDWNLRICGSYLLGCQAIQQLHLSTGSANRALQGSDQATPEANEESQLHLLFQGSEGAYSNMVSPKKGRWTLLPASVYGGCPPEISRSHQASWAESSFEQECAGFLSMNGEGAKVESKTRDFVLSVYVLCEVGSKFDVP